MSDVQKLINSPTLSNGVAVTARIVLRRFELTPRDVENGCCRGAIKPGGKTACDLVANGSVVASGTITERDGTYFFEGAKQ